MNKWMNTGIRQYAPIHIWPEESLVNIFSHTTDTNLCVLLKMWKLYDSD